jgi:hypothetical protein
MQRLTNYFKAFLTEPFKNVLNWLDGTFQALLLKGIVRPFMGA